MAKYKNKRENRILWEYDIRGEIWMTNPRQDWGSDILGLFEEPEGRVGLSLLRKARVGSSGIKQHQELEVKSWLSGRGLHIICANVEGHSRWETSLNLEEETNGGS